MKVVVKGKNQVGIRSPGKLEGQRPGLFDIFTQGPTWLCTTAPGGASFSRQARRPADLPYSAYSGNTPPGKRFIGTRKSRFEGI